ncbi:MAG: L,D-transpeptidase family protein [Eubacterium sp.]|nr:L,D-transpeptidase family protein [Eubacterium sp.]
MKRRAGLFIVVLMLLMLPLSVETRAAGKYTVYVNRKSNIVNVVENSSGKVVKAMWCSTGKRYKTPRGTFKLKTKYRWRPMIHGYYAQYASRITRGILFHAVPSVGKGHARVKNSALRELGRQASSGCVRLACIDAKWVYNNVPKGTKIVIGENHSMVTPTRPIAKPKKKSGKGWDPTDPDSRNPYRPSISLKSAGKKAIPKGTAFDIKNYVSVSSKLTASGTLWDNATITGKVDTSVSGKYKVTVKVFDPLTLLSRSKSFTFTVK